MEGKGDGALVKKKKVCRPRTRVSKTMAVCYGYEVDERGCLRPRPGEADVVIYIYHRFLSGQSMGQIAGALARMGVPSPSGKARWSRATVANILSNEKYVGDVMLGRSRRQPDGQEPARMAGGRVLLRDHHPALIARGIFEAAQEERRRRRRGQRAQEPDQA